MISSIASRPYSVKSYGAEIQIRHTLILDRLVYSEEQDNNLQVLKVILLYILGKVVHLEAKPESLNRPQCWTVTLERSSRYLYRASHGAEGKHSSAVFNGGLAVKRSLSVDQQHSHLMEGHGSPALCPLTRVSTARGLGSSVSAANLAAIGLVDHKDFTPDLDSCGLPLTAPPPGETCQRLLISSHPGVTLTQRGH